MPRRAIVSWSVTRDGRTAPAQPSIEQRIDELLGVERPQIVDLLADADEAYGNRVLAGDRRDARRPSPCRRAWSARCRSRRARRRRPAPGPPRSGRCWRRARARSRAVRPGIAFCVTRFTFLISSIRCSCVGSRPAVSAISTSMPRALADWMASKITAAASPDSCEITVTSLRSPQMRSCSRAAARNVSPAASDHGASLVLEVLGELADGGGLAAAVDPGHHDHEGLRGADLERHRQRSQQLEQGRLEREADRFRLRKLAPAHLCPHFLQQMLGRRDADVARDEHGLQVLEQRFVDLRMAAEEPRELASHALARARETLLEAARPAFLGGLEETSHRGACQRCRSNNRPQF